jgi:hypothetical protein
MPMVGHVGRGGCRFKGATPFPRRGRPVFTRLDFPILLSFFEPVASQHGGHEDNEERAAERNDRQGRVIPQHWDEAKTHSAKRSGTAQPTAGG